jgi:hypothetical protein
MWLKLTALLLFGYILDGRSFAYLGLPSYNIYVGELCLALFLLFGPRVWRLVQMRAATLYLLLGVNLIWGLVQAARGLNAGYPPILALRDCAFNYYPLFVLLGVLVACRDEWFLVKFVRALAWMNALYGIAFILLLNRIPWATPGTSDASSMVPLFSQTGGSALVLLGLVALEPKWTLRTWMLALLNLLVMLGLMVRSEWVGFLAGLLTFGICAGRLRQIALGVAGVAALLAVLFVADVKIPAPLTRGGGELSAQSIAARGLAIVDAVAGTEYAGESGGDAAMGDILFRTQWWSAIWNEVNSDPVQALAGFGYGYPIGDLNPSIAAGTVIRTPHNDMVYALGYSGWIGLSIFLLCQLEFALLLLRAFQTTGQPFGLMYWAMTFTASCFGNLFENPFGAIPFYLMLGLAIAPALLYAPEAERAWAPRAAAAPLEAEILPPLVASEL